MPSRVTSEWNGDEIIRRVEQASREAINDVIKDCVADAKQSHWWISRRGMEPGPKRLKGGLEKQIKAKRATINDGRITGMFGSTVRGFYGLFLEYKLPWLRPVADRNFPTLAARIREKLR